MTVPLRNVKKQRLEGALEIDIDISIKFLVLDEQLKTQGSVFCRISIIIFKGHVNPQACK